MLENKGDNIFDFNLNINIYYDLIFFFMILKQPGIMIRWDGGDVSSKNSEDM